MPEPRPAAVTCTACGHPIVPLVARDGRLVIEVLAGMIEVLQARLTCPRCGQVRNFVGGRGPLASPPPSG